MNSSLPLSTPPQNFTSEPENVTIQKQRKELQLLIFELKDRDKELNDMVAVHQRQLLSWEDDRQKILTLAERCKSVDDELHKRNEIIKNLTKRLKLLESKQSDYKVTVENTQQKLQEVSRTALDTSLHCQALEEKNEALSCSVMELSNKIGKLQAREQELITMLKLKDNDILEASNHITKFTCKFRKLEKALQAATVEEASIKRESLGFKLQMKELMQETNKLKGDLSEKTKENNEQREEIIRLKQENDYLSNELVLGAERANRKDQLLQSAKSKQLRSDTELSNLRQIYMKQQQDLQFLSFNLESSQQRHKRGTNEVSRGMVLSDLENSSEKGSPCSETIQKTHTQFVHIPSCSSKNTCQACRWKSRQTTSPKERLSANLDQFQEGLVHEPSTLDREASKQNGSLWTAGKETRIASESENAWKKGGREMSRALEPNPIASLPIHEHWVEINSPTEATDDQGDGRHLEADTSGILCARCLCAASSSVPPSEPGGCCCLSASKAATHQPVSDQEWMQIFKRRKEEGGPRQGGFPNGPQAADGTGSDKSKSDRDMSRNALDLGDPCLTSTQKTNVSERQDDAEVPLKLLSLADSHTGSHCCHHAVHNDSCSPTSKLQRLLAESRQMVADLELSNLLGASPCCSPSCGHHMVMESLSKLPAEEGNEMKLSLFSL